MKILVITLLVTFSLTAYGETPLKGRALDEHIKATRAKCEQRKNELLSAAREEKINTCIETKEFEPDKCRRYYSDYGNSATNPAGRRFRAGMFDDIPECIEADEAQKMKGTSR